jgi:hypothetical protein
MKYHIDEPYKDIIGLLLGVVFVVIGISSWMKRIRLLKRGIKTTGVVVDFEAYIGKSTSYPVVKYKTVTGKWVTKKYYIGSSFTSYKVGDDVPVIYDKNTPEDYLIDNFTSKLIGPVFAIIGLGLIVSSVIHLI